MKFRNPEQGEVVGFASPGGTATVRVGGKLLKATAPYGVAGGKVLVFTTEQGEYYAYPATTTSVERKESNQFKKRPRGEDTIPPPVVGIVYSITSVLRDGPAIYTCESPDTLPEAPTILPPVSGEPWLSVVYFSPGAFLGRLFNGGYIAPMNPIDSLPAIQTCPEGGNRLGVSNCNHLIVGSFDSFAFYNSPRLVFRAAAGISGYEMDFNFQFSFSGGIGSGPGGPIEAEIGMSEAELKDNLLRFYGIKDDDLGVFSPFTPTQGATQSTTGVSSITDFNTPWEIVKQRYSPDGSPVLIETPPDSGRFQYSYFWIGAPICNWRYASARWIVQEGNYYGNDAGLSTTRARRGFATGGESSLRYAGPLAPADGLLPVWAYRAYRGSAYPDGPPPSPLRRGDTILLYDTRLTRCSRFDIGTVPTPPRERRKAWDTVVWAKKDTELPSQILTLTSARKIAADSGAFEGSAEGDSFSCNIASLENQVVGVIKWGRAAEIPLVDPPVEVACRVKLFTSAGEEEEYHYPEPIPLTNRAWVDFRANYSQTDFAADEIPNPCFGPQFRVATDRLILIGSVNLVEDNTKAVWVDTSEPVTTPEGDFSLYQALLRYDVPVKVNVAKVSNESGTCIVSPDVKEYEIVIRSIHADLPSGLLTDLTSYYAAIVAAGTNPTLWRRQVNIQTISIWLDTVALGL